MWAFKPKMGKCTCLDQNNKAQPAWYYETCSPPPPKKSKISHLCIIPKSVHLAIPHLHPWSMTESEMQLQLIIYIVRRNLTAPFVTIGNSAIRKHYYQRGHYIYCDKLAPLRHVLMKSLSFSRKVVQKQRAWNKNEKANLVISNSIHRHKKDQN